MSTDLSLNLLIIAGILVILNNILHFSFNPDKISGSRLSFLILVIFVTLVVIFGGYTLQFNGPKIDKKEYAAIYNRNEQLMKVNDSLKSVILVVDNHYDRVNESFKPLTEIAIDKYPDLEPEEALEKLAGDIKKMEKTIDEFRPHLVFLGDTTKMAESRSETFYFTTYYFRAKGSAVRNLKIGFNFTGYIASVTGLIDTGTKQFEKGRIRLNDDSKGFTYRLDLLPLESDLRLTVKSRDWLTVTSKAWSPR
jgi:hypothetical protein